MFKQKPVILLLAVFLLSVTRLIGQKPHQPSAAEIYQKLKKLSVFGNVLYLAAHPDDENTRFISYCANEKLFNTAYLSLTRGDGGQNLIGPEIREELGIIRTQELLAARRIDGGRQFFSRANDFGYSKTPEETQKIWDREQVLSDIVFVIRKFQPDVIVCRFPPDSRGGHGHHTSSAQLGIEAFKLAGKKDAFPEQLSLVKPWQPVRIVTNTGRWWNDDISADDPGVVAEDIGTYNGTLGISYNEMAALSRSQHKSQGFGSTGSRGELLEYFEHLEGEQADKSLFEGFETSWSRLPDSRTAAKLANDLMANFSFENPAKSIPGLVKLYQELEKLSPSRWREVKMKEVRNLILSCAGLYLEAKADGYSAVPGDSVKVSFEFVNRSPENISLTEISSEKLSWQESREEKLGNNQVVTLERGFKIPENMEITQPFWLKEKGTLGMYKVEDKNLTGVPENAPAISFKGILKVAGMNLDFSIPLIYKWNDPVKGEQYRPFVVTPPATATFLEGIHIFSGNQSREIRLLAKCHASSFEGELQLKVPSGWKVDKASHAISFSKKGEEQMITIGVTPDGNPGEGLLQAEMVAGGKSYALGFSEIAYDHIPTQVWFPPAESKLVFVDLKKQGNKIGYLQGAGDVVPVALRNIGYDVDELTEEDINQENLKKYNAVMLGIRALNTVERIDFLMPEFLEYARTGGTLILQYNTSYRLKTEKFSPYSLTLSRDRVTEEDAEVTFLAPDHPVLNTPNKITTEDFNGWTQERGLYFPNEWGEEFSPILSWNDEGEDPKKGALLVAPYGEGHYIYTGISFFRVLPGGAPGAFRLLANLISLGNE